MCKKMYEYFVVRYFKEDFYVEADVLYPVQNYVFSLCFSLSLSACLRFYFLFSASLFFKERQYSVQQRPDCRPIRPLLNENR